MLTPDELLEIGRQTADDFGEFGPFVPYTDN